jgi:TonB family protein
MRRSLLPAILVLAACATQSAQAPPPAWRTVEQCDPNLPVVSSPRIINRVNPIVPNYTGTHFVQVESVIDETGRISSICRVSGEPEFVESVLQAMRQWTFEPAMRDGKPVKVLFSLTTRFYR